MARARLPMRKLKDIIRLKFEGRTHREIARSLGVSAGAVGSVSKGAETRSTAIGKCRALLGDTAIDSNPMKIVVVLR